MCEKSRLADHVRVFSDTQVSEPCLDLNEAKIPLRSARPGTRESGKGRLSVRLGRIIVREVEIKIDATQAVLSHEPLLIRLDAVLFMPHAVTEFHKELLNLTLPRPLADDTHFRAVRSEPPARVGSEPGKASVGRPLAPLRDGGWVED